MKLKKILENLDSLDEGLKGLYTKGADNKFHLEVEDDDTGPLLRAKEHEANLRKIAEQNLANVTTELETAKARVQELTAAQSSDVARVRSELEQTYGTQIAELKKTHSKDKERLEATIKKVFVDQVAERIANEISTVPELMTESLKKRLVVEIVDGEPITRVLSADGKASAMSPDDLQQEYFTNDKYAAILRASDASGGGAQGSKKGGGASKKLADMNDSERAEWAERDPAGFQSAVDAQSSTTVI